MKPSWTSQSTGLRSFAIDQMGRTLSVAGFVLAGLMLTPWPSLAVADKPSSDIAPSSDQVDFESQIAPILAEHCLGCHSPNIKKGELSLATADDIHDLQYVHPGKAGSSRLLEVISSVDGAEPEMPMDGEPLADDSIALIRRWIDQGALWPDTVVVREKSKADDSWWSLQPLQQQFAHNTIDEFIDGPLQASKLKRNAPADRRTLIRRATYDLTGLPPTPDQVRAFVDSDDPLVYEKWIDHLLASPEYGQRWGRHWLDVVRFGESIGFERNVIINELWPFRDYIIRSLNADRPFDQLIREHIAGDVLNDPSIDATESAIGTAFLVSGPYDDVGNQDAAQAAQIRANTLDEIIRATSEAFLGLTVGCARCHDHKFDPIAQDDYYALYATFAGVRHGAVPLATPEDRLRRETLLEPLQTSKAKIQQQISQIDAAVMKRANANLAQYQKAWPRPAVDRRGTEETFDPIVASHVRLVCKAQDNHPSSKSGFRIDEFEVWSSGDESESVNVALASNGATASGAARQIQDFADAYGPQLTIDGKTGARFIAAESTLTIHLAQPTEINRVFFSSGRGEADPNSGVFTFVAEYDIEVSSDAEQWIKVATGDDRQPIQRDSVLNRRLSRLAITDDERQQKSRLESEMRDVNRRISAVPATSMVYIGRRVADDAKGPFHLFIGGSPQRKGDAVVPSSLSSLRGRASDYQLSADADEATRRRSLADWLVDDSNPLTPRVLANRIWHFHFGTGIVDTPNDFGYMGGRPTHPELLDFLATQLQQDGWRIKPMHRRIMLSKTYRQSSDFDEQAARSDADARLLWRFPPRRLSAEEIRDTLLQVAGQLDTTSGGPGFRLYQFLQDNVCTYLPLDQHGPETYRRAVYHQNARASVVDLMTEFDQPDCTFSAPRRSSTTTPLQALTLLNHSFTMDMAASMAARIRDTAGPDHEPQIHAAYQRCYARAPQADELAACRSLLSDSDLTTLCRVLLNTSELIDVR
ncbi:DUF1553 domain-containing protein [Rubripirellula lacrimiformis]|nr:DUF1553 domain-containing protein [Rubripirellula lacrimiformis]